MSTNLHVVPIGLAHVRDFQALAADPAVCVPLSYQFPYPEDGAEQYVRKRIQAWLDGKAYTFAVLLGETFIGACGLHSINRKAASTELAFWIGKPFWGRGFARHAVGRILEMAFTEFAFDSVTACSLETNQGAIRTLESHGFQFIYSGIDYNPQWQTPAVLKFFELTAEQPSIVDLRSRIHRLNGGAGPHGERNNGRAETKNSRDQAKTS